MNGKSKKPTAGDTAIPKAGFSDWVTSTFDIPPEILEGGLSLEMRGRNRLLIRGCRRILTYAPEEMQFQMKGCVLTVSGKCLICHSFLSGAVGIEGKIHSISFGDRPGEEVPSC